MSVLAEVVCRRSVPDVVGLFALLLLGLAIGFALGVNSARRR